MNGANGQAESTLHLIPQPPQKPHKIPLPMQKNAPRPPSAPKTRPKSSTSASGVKGGTMYERSKGRRIVEGKPASKQRPASAFSIGLATEARAEKRRQQAARSASARQAKEKRVQEVQRQRAVTPVLMSPRVRILSAQKMIPKSRVDNYMTTNTTTNSTGVENGFAITRRTYNHHRLYAMKQVPTRRPLSARSSQGKEGDSPADAKESQSHASHNAGQRPSSAGHQRPVSAQKRPGSSSPQKRPMSARQGAKPKSGSAAAPPQVQENNYIAGAGNSKNQNLEEALNGITDTLRVEVQSTSGSSSQGKASNKNYSGHSHEDQQQKRPSTASSAVSGEVHKYRNVERPSTVSAAVVKIPGRKERTKGRWTSAAVPMHKHDRAMDKSRLLNEKREALPGYNLGHVIGKGGFCQVRLGIQKLTKEKVAVKVIDKFRLNSTEDRKRVDREIRVLKRLNHCNIIHMFEAIETESKIFVVMEHANNGSLLDYVKSKRRLGEREACLLFQQILSGMDYCHHSKVIHRDIKLENLLLDDRNNIKIIDFGLSAIASHHKKLKVYCGSPSYAAPEIVARRHYCGPPADIWSLGVVLFAMISGYLPFHAGKGNKAELSKKILRGSYSSPDFISKEARDLLSMMLTVEPSKRATSEQIWRHKWVQFVRRQEIPSYGLAVKVDPVLGVVEMEEDILQQMELQGFDRARTMEYLVQGECNHTTATYFLMLLSKKRAMNSDTAGPEGTRLLKAIA
ncbi:serine/threonine protein kinase [Chloropicon primus]|uniref:Serine/threonine protein kinase n=1 Tax=Chloropicon primus TaxID=1764295 RepID=A0A5B8MQT0_9CHLO|nr:serine/threonine protein kinase [Chloropicon primus]UPR02123.1 serine/threonine protein kinase [Chloropicon primus]|eukprot:QDZ22899.1 serine/threonine protein kinase [Chloropicon primus]